MRTKQPRKHTTGPRGTAGNGIPAAPGAYVLAIRLARPVEVAFRRLPSASLLPGWYAYAGSARGPGGLAARIGRHLLAEKRPRWHVDALSLAAAEIEALAFPGEDECALLARLMDLEGAAVPLPGFGASDCATCPAHLIALPDRPALVAPASAAAPARGNPRPRAST